MTYREVSINGVTYRVEDGQESQFPQDVQEVLAQADTTQRTAAMQGIDPHVVILDEHFPEASADEPAEDLPEAPSTKK